MTKIGGKTWNPFIIGDQVWLEATNIEHPLLPRKLVPRRYGPFPVIQVLSKVAYKLRLPKHWKIHPTFHAELLSPYQTNEWYGKPKASPQLETIDGQEEFEVDKILDHRKRGKKTEYLIAWKGYSLAERSWELQNYLTNAQEAIHTYWANKEQRKDKKRQQ